MKTILLTVLVFGIIITLHEAGHFLFAKLFRVKVEEFSFVKESRAEGVTEPYQYFWRGRFA